MSSDTPADSMRQRYIQRLKDEGKKGEEDQCDQIQAFFTTEGAKFLQ